MFNELTLFVLGAGFNLAVALLVVRFIYYPVTQDKNYVFTFLAFSTIIYFVLGLFTRTDLSVGVGFGLFAIFSVLRYRTDEMPIREMTYLFIIIALPVMNSIFMSNGDLVQLLVANGVIVGLLYVLEREWGFHFEESRKITYERIDLIIPARRDELLADLRERSGLPIKRVEIGRLDFLRDTAEMRVYYDESRRGARAIEPGAAISDSLPNHQATKRIILRPSLKPRDSAPHERDAPPAGQQDR